MAIRFQYRTQLPTKAPGPRSPTDPDWQQWIAENLLRGCSQEGMLETMIRAGLDARAAQSAILAMKTQPVFQAALRHQRVQKKYESVLANLQRLWSSDVRYKTIERRTSVETEEFLERYVRGCRPVVLTGIAADWPALKKWTPEYFKAKFGHVTVEVQAGRSFNPRYELEKHRHSRHMQMSEFVEMVENEHSDNDCYLTANNDALGQAALAPLLQDVGSVPAFCDRAKLAGSSFLWFGPRGTVTPLHHDTVMLLHTQVFGRKRWRFVSPLQTPCLYNFLSVFSPVDLENPDLAKWPRAADAQILETEVGPGETVFLPLGWWHHVTSLETSVSLSYSGFVFPNEFSYDNADNADWL